MVLKTYPHDASEHLDTPDAQEEYLVAAFETGDPAFIADALGVVARAKGMSDLARKTGLTRPALSKALSAEGNPELATILKVAEALGFRLAPHRIALEA